MTGDDDLGAELRQEPHEMLEGRIIALHGIKDDLATQLAAARDLIARDEQRLGIACDRLVKIRVERDRALAAARDLRSGLAVILHYRHYYPVPGIINDLLARTAWLAAPEENG